MDSEGVLQYVIFAYLFSGYQDLVCFITNCCCPFTANSVSIYWK
jgi:hypothetical protein